MTDDGKPYSSERFKVIVKEQYIISKSIHTSFTDVDKITPRERELLIEYISKDNNKLAEAYSKMSKNKE